MRTVEIPASCPYRVLIGRGLLSQAGELIRAVSDASTAVIVSGEHVYPLYGSELERALERGGFRLLHWVHSSGEKHKNLESYGKLLNYLSENHIGRGDLLLSLGGGVTGDLTGFAAATYQRGMDYVQIPTTLLAMVDSSVGGKTAVNLPAGKNLAGCFHQPKTVLCDPNLLSTLPEREYRSGCAEVIKYAMLCSPALFRQLQTASAWENPEQVIECCVAIKRDYVGQDEFDVGVRRFLNLGHSFGHAVEACSGYACTHGEAISVGMAMIARAAAEKGICTPDARDALLALLEKYKLPTETDIPLDQLQRAVLSDKKRKNEQIHLVVPETIGRCRIIPVPVKELPEWLRLGGAR
jgi:3-dehydroquinate synthase